MLLKLQWNFLSRSKKIYNSIQYVEHSRQGISYIDWGQSVKFTLLFQEITFAPNLYIFILDKSRPFYDFNKYPFYSC